MSEEKKKTAVQEMRELHEKIRNNIEVPQELIDILIKTGKVKRKDETDKKVARPFTPEAGD